MEWYKCPYCKQKLFEFDKHKAHAEGIFIKCKGRDCKRIIEIKIEKEKS